jgi:hypothetical protein
MRKVFLENLPHGKNSEKNKKRKGTRGQLVQNKRIDWINSIGYFIHFIFDDIEGDFEIIKYESIKGGIITIKYNNEEFKVNTINLRNSQIQTILFKRNEYKYQVGDIVDTNTGKIKILKQIRLPNMKKYTQKGYEYECLNCGNIDTIAENKLFNMKVGCNVCCPSPTKVLKGYNDIATTEPWIVEWLDNKEDAYKYTANTNKKVWFKCKHCGTKKKMRLDNFNVDYFPCPKCGDGISYPNKFAFNLLENLNIDFETEYSPSWISPKRYDFYFKLNNNEYILEMDGGLGHGKRDNTLNGKSKEESKATDDYKDGQAKLHGIEIIRIDCDYGKIENRFKYIKQNILNSRLSELFDLNLIAWNDIEKFALSNLIKRVCELWNLNKYTIKDIANIIKMSTSTIRKYLHKGNDMCWCIYVPEKQTQKIEIYKNNKLIGIYNNAFELEKISEQVFGEKFKSNAIGYVCKGTYKQHKGYVFKYHDN